MMHFVFSVIDGVNLPTHKIIPCLFSLFINFQRGSKELDIFPPVEFYAQNTTAAECCFLEAVLFVPKPPNEPYLTRKLYTYEQGW
jgi:hypothetical protein